MSKKYIMTVLCKFDIEVDPEDATKEENIEYIESLPVDDVANMKVFYDNDSMEITQVIKVREVED